MHGPGSVVRFAPNSGISIGRLGFFYAVALSHAAARFANRQSHAKRVTAPTKYPRRIAFVDDLPKTPTGKIRRRRRDREFGEGGER